MNLDTDQIIEDLVISDANGENAVEVIVTGHQSSQTRVGNNTIESNHTSFNNDERIENNLEDLVSDFTDANDQ